MQKFYKRMQLKLLHNDNINMVSQSLLSLTFAVICCGIGLFDLVITFYNTFI